MSRSGTQADLRGALARAGNGGAPARQSGKTIKDLIESMKGEIARALPKHISPERFARIALTEVRRTPKLLSCNSQSLLASLMLAAQLGLEPGPLGQCYLVPYGNECSLIIGYKGYLDLIWRSGQLKSLAVHEVCENDEFEFAYGLEERLHHVPARSNRGPTIGYYLVSHYKDGGHFIYWMSREDVDQLRRRSRASNDGPWKTDYDAMARKTVVRQAARWMPLSIETQRALAQDEAVKVDLAEDMTEVPDAYDVEARVLDDDFLPADGENADN